MNFKKMASEIARLEGKKREVSIGNIREVLKITLHLLGKEIMLGNETEKRDILFKQLLVYGHKKLR